MDFAVQDKDEGNKYKVFTTTAAVCLSGGDFRVTVALKIAGLDVVSAQRMLVTASSEAQRVSTPVIYAAPFDALAYNGMQINGSMEVSQELEAPVRHYTISILCDGWKYLLPHDVVLPSLQRNLSAGIHRLPQITSYVLVAATRLQVMTIHYAHQSRATVLHAWRGARERAADNNCVLGVTGSTPGHLSVLFATATTSLLRIDVYAKRAGYMGIQDRYHPRALYRHMGKWQLTAAMTFCLSLRRALHLQAATAMLGTQEISSQPGSS